MSELLIEICPDGTAMIHRGERHVNKILLELVSEIVDEGTFESISAFFAVVEDSQLLFGYPDLCG